MTALAQKYAEFSRSILAGVAALLVVSFVIDWRLGLILSVWLAAWGVNIVLTESGSPARRFVVPTLFGITLLVLWQMSVRLFDISQVILPAPTDI